MLLQRRADSLLPIRLLHAEGDDPRLRERASVYHRHASACLTSRTGQARVKAYGCLRPKLPLEWVVVDGVHGVENVAGEL